MRGFSEWLKIRIFNISLETILFQRLIGLEVVRDSDGKLTWTKEFLKIKKEGSSSESLEGDITVSRHCIKRAMSSSWWDWFDGSRSFFRR